MTCLICGGDAHEVNKRNYSEPNEVAGESFEYFVIPGCWWYSVNVSNIFYPQD